MARCLRRAPGPSSRRIRSLGIATAERCYNRVIQLPNPQRAIVDIAKLRGYCLNPLHPKGGHKARVFQAALGLSAKDAEWLRSRLLDVSSSEATEAGVTRFGRRYVIDFILRTPVGHAIVRSSWIVREEEDFPRLFTCYVKKKTRL